jgi:hypothetical protein
MLKAVAWYNNWESSKKTMHLLATLQGWAAEVLYGVLKKGTYKETTEALESGYRDHHMAAGYGSQMKARTQLIRKSLLESATTVKQLTNCTPAQQPEHYIHKEGDHALVDGIRDQDTAAI